MRPLSRLRHCPCPPRASCAAAARVPATAAAVVVRAAGAPLLAVPNPAGVAHRARLVDPTVHGCPVGVDLDLFPVERCHAPCHAAASRDARAAPAPTVHTLYYILGGAGTLVGDGAPPVPLRAGDCAAARGARAVLVPAPDAPPFAVDGVDHALAAIVVTLPSSKADADGVAAAAAARVAGGARVGTLTAAGAADACGAARVQAAGDGVVVDSDDEDSVVEALRSTWEGGGDEQSSRSSAATTAATEAAAVPSSSTLPPSTSSPPASPPPLVRSLASLPAFRMMPAGTNRIALAFDPARAGVPFCAGVEVFDAGHVTPRHAHGTGHELFVVLDGAGVGECDGARFDLGPGDVAVFPPASVHGLDAPSSALVCLELMSPDDRFGDAVRSGVLTGTLTDSELCALAAVGCGGGGE